VKLAVVGGKDYHKFIKNIVAYTKISSEDMKNRIDVEGVVPRGDYIMGLFGGKKRLELGGMLVWCLVLLDTRFDSKNMTLTRLNHECMQNPGEYNGQKPSATD